MSGSSPAHRTFFKRTPFVDKGIHRGKLISTGAHQGVRKAAVGAGQDLSPVVNGYIPSSPDGWILFTFLKGDVCSMNCDEMNGGMLNYCFPDDNDSSMYKYNPETSNIDRYMFKNDPNCSTEAIAIYSEANGTCVQDNGFSVGLYAVLTPEIPIYDEYITLELFYGDDGCTPNPPIFYAYRNNHCQTDIYGESGAVFYDYPTITYYESLESCTGNVSSVFALDTNYCYDFNAPSDDAYYDDAYYYDGAIYDYGKYSFIDPGSSPYPSSASSSSSSDKLSGGAIAGIAIGAVAAVAMIAALVFLFVLKKSSKGDDVPLKANPVNEVEAVPVEKVKTADEEHA